MGELKRIRVRTARDRDVGLFRKLWSQFLEVRVKQGSKVSPSTLPMYEGLFNLYVEGVLPGIVLFVADKGVLMWGTPGEALAYQEKTIIAWGQFADGNLDIKKAMIDAAEKWAKENGFFGVIGESFGKATLPSGFEEIGTIIHKKL